MARVMSCRCEVCYLSRHPPPGGWNLGKCSSCGAALVPKKYVIFGGDDAANECFCCIKSSLDEDWLNEPYGDPKTRTSDLSENFRRYLGPTQDAIDYRKELEAKVAELKRQNQFLDAAIEELRARPPPEGGVRYRIQKSAMFGFSDVGGRPRAESF